MTINHWINGSEHESSDGRTFDTVNPWTQSAWTDVAEAGQGEVDDAVGAARAAFDGVNVALVTDW